MIGILRYSAGNAANVSGALNRLGAPSRYVEQPAELDGISGLIFPGVGSAQTGMADLQQRGFVSALQKFDRPFLGICLGMQLLFDSSEEGNTPCLGIIPGKVQELPTTVVRPHMGWNRLSTGGYVYFVHGYVCVPADSRVITMSTWHGVEICAGVRFKNFFGVQWHPEKSSTVGDNYLRAFAKLCK